MMPNARNSASSRLPKKPYSVSAHAAIAPSSRIAHSDTPVTMALFMNMCTTPASPSTLA